MLSVIYTVTEFYKQLGLDLRLQPDLTHGTGLGLIAQNVRVCANSGLVQTKTTKMLHRTPRTFSRRSIFTTETLFVS